MYWIIEGPDGVGKTTVMQAVARLLIAEGITDLVLTKEPGGPAALFTEWDCPVDLKPYFGFMYESGPLVREFCVNHPEIPQLAKRALFKADSLCNWEQVISPSLANDNIVLSDRGWPSDLVYGSVLTKLDVHALYQFNMALVPSQHGITHVIHLTAPSDVREARLSTNVTNHMDKLGPQVRDELARAYQRIIPQYVVTGQHWTVDTNRSVAAVARTIVDLMLEV